MSEEAKVNTHAFSGACAPGALSYMNMETFSVGIFEWIPKSTKGLKKSPVKVRVSGPTSQPEMIYKKAREIVAQLDAGTYTGPKKVKV